MSPGPYMIGIGGPSCSGKSEIAQCLKTLYAGLKPVILSLDAYYRDLSALPLEERERRNFDSPSALEIDLLYRQVEALARGETIERPRYDFTTHTRLPIGTRVVPGALVVVEGLFSLYWEHVRCLFHTLVFVGVPDDILLQRRIDRDSRERGRTEASILRQYEATVRPMTREHILPTRAFAHVVVNGSDPLELSVGQIMAHLRPVLGMASAVEQEPDLIVTQMSCLSSKLKDRSSELGAG